MPKLSSLIRLLVLIAPTLLLSGCLLGPDYVRPETEAQLPASFAAPAGWKLAQPGDEQPRGDWWKRFQSPELDRLIERAHGRNQSLVSAVARVDQSRAILSGSRSAFFPTVELSPSVSRTRRSGTINNAAPNLRGARVTNYSLPALLSYEPDLWGELRRAAEAAKAGEDVSRANLLQAKLTLEAELSAQFFRLGTLDSEIAILEEAVTLRRRALDLNRKRFRAGDTDEVDVTRAETELAATEVDLIETREARELVENAIAALVGEPAGEFSLTLPPERRRPPIVPVSSPTDLLERRPDVAAAERAMIAENARIGIAKAAFFPSLRISANVGLESGDAARLFDLRSRGWGLGPEFSLPILDAGRNRAELKRARARYEETVALYRETILQAVRQVADALVTLKRLDEKVAAQQRTVTAAERTVELSRRRHEAGLVAYFEVVDAQRTELDSRRLALQFELARYLATITLVRALGGDWHPATT